MSAIARLSLSPRLSLAALRSIRPAALQVPTLAIAILIAIATITILIITSINVFIIIINSIKKI